MLVRSFLLPNTRKIVGCNTLYPQIRYGSNYAKNDKSSQLTKVFGTQIDKLRKRFPRLSAIYSLVYGGIRGMASDFKKFFEIMSKRSQNNGGLTALTLEELEFYHSFKINSRKLIPITILAVLPFGNMFIVPLAYFIPRKTVTHHFWTENQRITFPLQDLNDRLKHQRPVLDYLQSCPSGRIPDKILPDWHNLLDKLDKNGRPEVSDIMKVSPLFRRSGPFYLQALPKLHIMHLGATYGLTSLYSPLMKILRFAELSVVVDKKIIEKGGPKKLPDELRSKICYMRGVDSTSMSKTEQIEYLQKWIQVNAKIDISNYSLLLHTPILLGYHKAHIDKLDITQPLR